MYAIVSTTIVMIANGSTKVEIVTIIIARIDSQRPIITYHIDRTIEIITIDKLAILAITQYIQEVLITHIEQVVIIIHCIIIAIHDIINHLIYMIEEIEVDFVHIFILTIAESQLMAHTIGKETCFTTYITQTHCRPTVGTNSCQGYKH